jgi:hypothetical protein
MVIWVHNDDKMEKGLHVGGININSSWVNGIMIKYEIDLLFFVNSKKRQEIINLNF